MRTIKFFTNLDAEEQWLNTMARRGCRFTRKTLLGYEFEPGKPDEAAIRMDYRTFKTWADFADYCALFEDSGWEHIAGMKRSGYQYFKKADAQGSEEIFSDVDSKADRYKRLSTMWASLACAFIPIFIALLSTGSIDPEGWLHPKSLYYTPGLWNLDGLAFWRAFLFETPFALFRGFSWLLYAAMIVSYLYFAFKASNQYKKR